MAKENSTHISLIEALRPSQTYFYYAQLILVSYIPYFLLHDDSHLAKAIWEKYFALILIYTYQV